MADQPWTDLATPGDIISIQATAGAGDTTDIAVLTFAGELWWRRSRPDRPDGWTWQPGGFPPIPTDPATAAAPTAATVVAPLGPDTDGAPLAVLGGSDVSVWVHRSPALDPAWTELPGPQNNGGLLRPLRLLGAAGEVRSVLAASDGVPWLVTLQDATGAFAPLFAVAPNLPDNWSMTGPACYVAGSPTPGGPPQPHAVLSVNVHEVWVPGMRVGYPAGGAWNWVDPGPTPDAASTDIVDAAGVHRADGSWEVWALFGGMDQNGPSFVLHGAGSVWSWEEIGKPVDTVYWPRCIADVGGQAWVAAQTVDDVWYQWTAAAGWTPLTGVPAGGYVWPGGAATAGGEAPWMVGLSGQRLWTWKPASATPQAVDHGLPVTAAAVVGPRPVGGDTPHSYVIDGGGRLWERGSYPTWIPHGVPTPDVSLQVPVGTADYTLGGKSIDSTFVVGDDTHLWERRADPDWSWVDHGGPGAGVVGAVLPPVAVVDGLGSTVVEVLVVGADAHLWARVVNATPVWEDRGLPGRRILGVVGADQVPAPQGGMTNAATVIGEDGHVWARTRRLDWVDLGVPPVGGGAVAGVGACMVKQGTQWPLMSVVLGTGGRLASVVWNPGAAPQPWKDLGAPPGVAVVGALGVVPLPTNDDLRVVVLGGDGAVWSRTAAGWTSWGRPASAEITQGRLAPLPAAPWVAAVVTTADGHLWSLPAPT